MARSGTGALLAFGGLVAAGGAAYYYFAVLSAGLKAALIVGQGALLPGNVLPRTGGGVLFLLTGGTPGGSYTVNLVDPNGNKLGLYPTPNVFDGFGNSRGLVGIVPGSPGNYRLEFIDNTAFPKPGSVATVPLTVAP